MSKLGVVEAPACPRVVEGEGHRLSGSAVSRPLRVQQEVVAVVIASPFFIMLGVMLAIMFVRARDRAPRCRFCRQTVAVSAVRCSHCGQELGATFTLLQERKTTGPAKNVDTSAFWWIAGIVTLAVLGGLAVAWMFK
jgi:hypothetical protein